MMAEHNLSKTPCFFFPSSSSPTGQHTGRKKSPCSPPRSEAVEGGRHGVDTELEESLTEGEAGTGEHDARHHGGRHHGQDQRQRQVPLWHGFRGDWRVGHERGRGWEDTEDTGKAHLSNITACHRAVQMTVDLLCHFV